MRFAVVCRVVCVCFAVTILGCSVVNNDDEPATKSSPDFANPPDLSLQATPTGGSRDSSTFTPSPATNVPGSIGRTAEDDGISDYETLSTGIPKFDAVSGALPSPPRDEELWVIAKSLHANEKPAPDDQAPGQGALLAKLPNQKEMVPVPLKHTDVKASIEGFIATVDVTQQYHNPYDSKIEAVYVFPLPENAAINEFVMTIGDRHIRGIIRERAEAQKIYREAKSQGYVASLLTQERPNIFTQSVANIEPGKEIDIQIKYFNTLHYSDGCYEFVFPMVVGPRFNPPGSSDGVGAVGRGSGGASGQAAEVQYLRPSERSGHDISLSLQINAGVDIEQIQCSTHHIEITGANSSHASVRLASGDTIPNRDFVLRYKVAGKTIKTAVMTQRDAHGDGGYFAMMVYPPELLANLPRKPLEMVFTVDVSGSQMGEPLDQEKAAVHYELSHMGPEDTFQLIKFGDSATRLFPHPVPADAEHVRTALQYVDSFDAGGGTLLVDGLRASLCFEHDPSRLRFVEFMTDGFIGNEEEALAEIHKDLGPSRIFSFGVGSSTNRYLLDHMAKMGNGVAAYLGLQDSADDVLAQFFERISHPAMTDISVDYGNLKVSQTYPSRLPDLFVGRPVVICGRYTGGGQGVIHIHGQACNEQQTLNIPVNFDDASSACPAIGAVWARMKIAELADRAAYEQVEDLDAQIKQIALEYGLMSKFTAFIAVDSTTRTSGDHGTSVVVPVPVPQGVRYDTTVTDP